MIVNGIDTKDISVVVQGAVDKINTPKCLESIRKFLPGAEIVLSTWEGTDTSGLDCDVLVLSVDPLSFPCDSISYSIPNNINRQLLSTQAGCKRASHNYILKLRTDFYLKSNDFLSYFGKYEKYNEKYRFFTRRILICSLYSRNPRLSFGNLRMPYCPSDFFAFGLADDVKALYARPLVTSDEDKLYFEIHPEKKDELRYKNALCRFMPEQFIWLGFISDKLEKLYCEHRDDVNRRNIQNTERTFANNFVILSPSDSGIDTFKTNLFTKGIPENCFSFSDWKLLYGSYCHKNPFLFALYLTKNYGRTISYTIAHSKQISKVRTNCNKTFLVNKISNFNISIDKNIDYYAFDIFDTMLMRNTSPSWCTMAQTPIYITMLIRPYADSVTIQKISELRNRFIQEEYEKNLSSGLDCEYNIYTVIEKILRFYNIDEEKIETFTQQIVDNEVKREIDCLYVNDGIIDLLKKLTASGKKLIVVSDMYFTLSNIEQILRHFGLYSYFTAVYVSSSYSFTKSSGKLFKKVLSENGIDTKRIIHIGNDFTSDICGAKKAGIKCLWYHNKRKLNECKHISDYIMARKSIAPLIESKLSLSNKPTFENVIKQIGVDINNFVFNMIIQAYINNIDCIYFLERDGNLYKKIFEVLTERISLFGNLRKIDLRLLKFPRKDSACLVDVSNPTIVIDRAEKVNPPKYFDLLHILGVFGLSLSNFTNSDQNQILLNRFNRTYFYKNYNKIFLHHFSNRKQKIENFLIENNFFDYKTIAVADIGWAGTIQKDLMAYLAQTKRSVQLVGILLCMQ